jgi:predicted nuclease of predicted toxin-antitoxin system
LSEHGHPSQHVEDIGLRHARDRDVWDFALKDGAVIITKDEDFVDHFRRQTDGPPIVWLRIGNASSRALLAWFTAALPSVIQRIDAGDKLIEVR